VVLGQPAFGEELLESVDPESDAHDSWRSRRLDGTVRPVGLSREGVGVRKCSEAFDLGANDWAFGVRRSALGTGVRRSTFELQSRNPRATEG
jgi:hypothetical protein